VLSEDDNSYGDEEDGEGEIDEETLKKLKEQGYDLQGGDNDDDEDDEFDQYGDEEEGEDDFNEDDEDYDDEDDEEEEAPAPKRAKK